MARLWRELGQLQEFEPHFPAPLLLGLSRRQCQIFNSRFLTLGLEFKSIELSAASGCPLSISTRLPLS